MKVAIGTHSATVESDRVAGFDLLRGVCALAVAAYHVLHWTKQGEMYTWGTYGVYVFFVLSGASMWIAYANRFARGLPMATFLRLRLIRLAPLYLLALAASLLLHARTGLHAEDVGKAFLNLSFQFGLADPGSTSMVLGGWSLGIEFVFYLLFPVFLALLSGPWWWLALLVAFASQHVFVAVVFANGKSLEANWSAYTQFLSFGFYFAAGCLIGRAVHTGRLRSHWVGLPVLIGCVAVIGSASGSTAASTLTGLAGVALSVIAVISVAAAAAVRVGPMGQSIAGRLGAASYGVYILHPLLSYPAHRLAGAAGVLPVTLLASLGLAMFLHRYFEQPVQARLKQF